MEEYNEECLLTFLKNQGRLFDEPVAENLAEAEAFLEDCMAVVVSSIEEVREYFAPLAAGAVLRSLADAFAYERGHDLGVRRYMWKMEY